MMADARVLTSSFSLPQNNPFKWDLLEIGRYNEKKCFTYHGNRIKWADSFKLLKIFVKCVIGEFGKWLLSGGKYKKFMSSNTDLILTWNHKLAIARALWRNSLIISLKKIQSTM